MVIVGGDTGSGISTTLASLVADRTVRPGRALTHESLIEFNYDALEKQGSLAPIHLDRNAHSVRKIPSLIMVGECQDRATMKEARAAVVSGHVVLMGIHAAGGVAGVLERIARLDSSPGSTLFADVVSSLSMITAQTLVPTVNGTRLALRETLPFGPVVAQELLTTGHDSREHKIHGLLAGRGEGFLVHARHLQARGVIAPETVDRVARAPWP